MIGDQACVFISHVRSNAMDCGGRSSPCIVSRGASSKASERNASNARRMSKSLALSLRLRKPVTLHRSAWNPCWVRGAPCIDGRLGTLTQPYFPSIDQLKGTRLNSRVRRRAREVPMSSKTFMAYADGARQKTDCTLITASWCCSRHACIALNRAADCSLARRRFKPPFVGCSRSAASQ